MVRVRFLAVQDFSLLHGFQTDSGIHPASCTMGTGDEADHSSPSGTVVKKVELYLHFSIYLNGIVLN
jgi:hypothetical protein